MRRRPPGSTLFPDPTLFRPARRPLRPRLPRRAGPIMFALEFSALASPVLLLFAFCASAPMSAETSAARSEEHTSELQSRQYLVCRLLLEKKRRLILNKQR